MMNINDDKLIEKNGKCPFCKGNNILADLFEDDNYICRNCGYEFNFSRMDNDLKHLILSYLEAYDEDNSIRFIDEE